MGYERIKSMQDYKSLLFRELKPSVQFLLILAFTVLNPSLVAAAETKPEAILIKAARVFDGNTIRTNTSVLVENGKVLKIDTQESLKSQSAR